MYSIGDDGFQWLTVNDVGAYTSRMTLSDAGDLTVANNIYGTNNVYAGGGYGNNGISLENNGNGFFNGALIVDSAFYVGGGYGYTGLTVDSAGNFGTNGMSQFGSNSLNVILGQNLIYGNIDTASTGNLMLLQKEDVDKFIITANGKVGIGDSTPDSILSIYGGVSIDNDSTVPSVSSGNLTVWDGLLKVCDGDGCSNNYANNDGDLYVEDDLEVGGDIILSGSLRKSDGDNVIEFSNGNVIIHLGQ